MRGTIYPRRLAAAVAIIIASLGGWQAAAADIYQRYDVTVSGLKAGEMELAVNQGGGRYTAKGLIRSSGIVGIFTSFSYGGTATGRILPDASLQPERYQGVRGDGTPERTTLIYDEGTPVSVAFDPTRAPRERDLEPGLQAGTVDPVSAAVMVLADAPSGRACNRSVEIYDGRRRSRISIGPRVAARDGWSCAGAYSRVAGYSEKQMREKVDFPFVIHYRELNGVMRVTRFQTDSIIGTAVATRR